MVELFVRIAVGVLVGGVLGAAVAYWTALPGWQIGAGAGALSAVLGSWAISGLRSEPAARAVMEPPETTRPPSN
ncbi:MAG: hypothetical protein U0360_01480 [Dehalococcoidia bacterium]